jgi:predicted RNase H-like HicB family nuclease
MSARKQTVHTFIVRRDDEQPHTWLATWSEDERVHTFGRSLAEVEEMARDALALWLHEAPAKVPVGLDVRVSPDLSRQVAELADLRRDLTDVQASVADRQLELARQLVRDERLTHRDAARLLGISHQRVAQLVNDGN